MDVNDTLRLFDDFERTDQAPARYAETTFPSLNRLAWRNMGHIRSVLEEWFTRFPSAHKQGLRRRFRSERDANHQGAFVELAVYSLFRQLDYGLQVDPLVERGLTPDFRADEAGDKALYLEATVVEPVTFKDSPREKKVFDELNRLRSPDFWLLARSVKGDFASNPPLVKMRHAVQKWIDGLDWDAARATGQGSRRYASYKLEHDGWQVQLDAVAKGEAARGQPARPLSGPMRSAFVDSSRPISKAVQVKAKRYQYLAAPLVVAVNCLDLSGAERIDLLLALFGWEESTSDPETARIAPPPSYPKRDHIWGSDKNAHVSGVLVFDRLQPHTLASASACLYENPWAIHPIPTSLRRLPCATVTGEVIRWHSGEALNSIFGLPKDWPGPK